MQFGLTISSVIILIALAIPGFILVRTKMLKESALPALSIILLYVNQPAFTISSFQQQGFSMDILYNMLLVGAVSIIMHLIILIIGHFVFSKDQQLSRGRAYLFASGFGNIGFMGLPLVKMLLPNNPEAVLYLAVMFVVFNIFVWTIGIFIVTGDKNYMSVKKAFINPPTLALIVAIPLFVFNVHLPERVMMPVEYLADMIVPLSMLILGMRFGASDIKKIFSDWGLYVSSFMKLIATPIIAYGIMKLIRLDDLVFTTVFILMAMPSASMGLIVAEKFGGDKEAAARAILGSSLFSIVTIPVVLLML